MRTSAIATLAALTLAPVAASAAGIGSSAAQERARAIEQAHHAELWSSKPALETHLAVEVGGKQVLEGTLLFETRSGRSRLQLADGTVAVWDGEHAWVSPASAEVPARFHLRTWPYFISVPMKLRDPGTRLDDAGLQPLDGKDYPAVRLSFAPSTGDTPGDWYLVYQDLETQRLRGLAFIVTYGTSSAEAEKSPYAMLYGEYAEVDGVPIATRLTECLWKPGTGITGHPVGQGLLSGMRFVTPAPDAFDKPAGAREDRMPQ